MATVTIKQGQLNGGKTKTDSGTTYYEFLGVPYAKPPIGDLRFKSPQPPESWTGVRDATSVNSDHISFQLDVIKGSVTGSDDCLYLNVYTPSLSDNGGPLPVMFFIHGGGFIYSNGIVKSELGPDYLIDNNVVVVTINYRLGVFGFLSLGIPEVAGNMGLKDQIHALKWVQENIKHFGGDSNNVTIFGISAGSASVEYLILSPLTKGLFHKAILQSGSSLNHWAINYKPQETVDQLLNEIGYNKSRKDVQAIYEFLLNFPASDLLEASFKIVQKSTETGLVFAFVPIVEKDFGNGDSVIIDKPYKLLKEGKYNRVPVIKGFCNKEGYLTVVMKSHIVNKLLEDKDFINYFPYQTEENISEQLNSRLRDVYYENISPNDEKDKVGIDFFGDLDFVAGIWLSGKIMAEQGVKVYFYNLCYDGNINFFKHYFGFKREGSAHGDDLAYLFKHTITELAQDRDIEVRTNMTKMWSNFAKSSKPSSSEVATQWLNYTESTPTYLKIDEDLSIVKSSYEPKKMELFDEIYNKYDN